MDLESIFAAFPDEGRCLAILERVLWKGGKPVCPYCGHFWSSPIPKEGRHHCNNCGTSFSVLVQTIFHGTRLDLRKWFLAIHWVAKLRKPPSVRDLASGLGVNENTASSILLKLRYAKADEREMLMGIVDLIDEVASNREMRA